MALPLNLQCHGRTAAYWEHFMRATLCNSSAPTTAAAAPPPPSALSCGATTIAAHHGHALAIPARDAGSTVTVLDGIAGAADHNHRVTPTAAQFAQIQGPGSRHGRLNEQRRRSHALGDRTLCAGQRNACVVASCPMRLHATWMS
jgi:hypothetical protein